MVPAAAPFFLLLVISPEAEAPTRSSEAAIDPDCIDAEIIADLLKQTPLDSPECGEDCIIMEWPWIDDVRIRRVLRGRAPHGEARVQTFQHTYWMNNSRHWALRRNSIGGFNMYPVYSRHRKPMCQSGAPRVRPFVRPHDGQTIDDLQRQGEDRWGRGPG